ISQRLEGFGARRAVRRLAAGAQGRIHLDQSPFNCAAELVPALLGRPSGIAWPNAEKTGFAWPSSAQAAASCHNSAPGSKGIAAAALSNSRLFMECAISRATSRNPID